jgi:hypothetical protein
MAPNHRLTGQDIQRIKVLGAFLRLNTSGCTVNRPASHLDTNNATKRMPSSLRNEAQQHAHLVSILVFPGPDNSDFVRVWRRISF